MLSATIGVFIAVATLWLFFTNFLKNLNIPNAGFIKVLTLWFLYIIGFYLTPNSEMFVYGYIVTQLTFVVGWLVIVWYCFGRSKK